jgi:hypothetical protein
MKRHLICVLVPAALLTVAAVPADAQTIPTAAQPVPRKDVTFTAGWLSGKARIDTESWNDWYNRSLYGGITGGYFWTDHLKTEVEVGAATSSKLHGYSRVLVDNFQTYRNSEVSFKTTRIAIGQQYQFYRNAWFHPHLGAGVDLLWETRRERLSAVTTYDSVTRQNRELRPAQDLGPETTLKPRAFGEMGFKAYMTPKTFFRTDLRITGRPRAEQVLFRFGFGVDF